MSCRLFRLLCLKNNLTFYLTKGRTTNLFDKEIYMGKLRSKNWLLGHHETEMAFLYRTSCSYWQVKCSYVEKVCSWWYRANVNNRVRKISRRDRVKKHNRPNKKCGGGGKEFLFSTNATVRKNRDLFIKENPSVSLISEKQRSSKSFNLFLPFVPSRRFLF